jgi:hypothetical protein
MTAPHETEIARLERLARFCEAEAHRHQASARVLARMASADASWCADRAANLLECAEVLRGLAIRTIGYSRARGR